VGQLGGSGMQPSARTGRAFAAVMAVVALLVGVTLPAVAAPVAKPDPKPKGPSPAEVTQRLNAVTEAQRMVAIDISQLRDQLSTLQHNLAEGRDEVRQNRDEMQTSLDQIKGMREEVRGLYVESSGLKGDIAQLGKQVEGLEDNLGNFRLSAGIVVAVIIVLQIALVGLMFRGRG
jgi:peptidoglycan hydrolase CwlO-like protein